MSSSGKMDSVSLWAAELPNFSTTSDVGLTLHSVHPGVPEYRHLFARTALGEGYGDASPKNGIHGGSPFVARFDDGRKRIGHVIQRVQACVGGIERGYPVFAHHMSSSDRKIARLPDWRCHLSSLTIENILKIARIGGIAVILTLRTATSGSARQRPWALPGESLCAALVTVVPWPPLPFFPLDLMSDPA